MDTRSPPIRTQNRPSVTGYFDEFGENSQKNGVLGQIPTYNANSPARRAGLFGIVRTMNYLLTITDFM